MSDLTPDANTRVCQIISDFQNRTGLLDIEHEVKDRSDGPALIFKMANPTDRYYRILTNIFEEKEIENLPTPTIRKSAPANRLQSPEAKFLLRTLAESLNINRFSFQEEFFDRYTKSVSNAESQITAAANNIVYGRRGAGKSSLLLYCLRTRESRHLDSAWIDMQTYEKRSDNKAALEILLEILRQLSSLLIRVPAFEAVRQRLVRLKGENEVTDDSVRALIPDLRQLISNVTQPTSNIFIFLDDFHLLDLGFQSRLLSFIYAITRGNNVFIKVSAIETLTRTWDPKSRMGLQVPHDAQRINLDYNLTMPDKAEKHIEGILDAHAIYCGLPSVRFLCTNNRVLPRLVWVSAGVPRDALNMFAQAMTKAMTAGRGRVSVTDLNIAASEMISEKDRDLEVDVLSPEEENQLQSVLERVKEFCIKQNRKNAFLVEIRRDSDLLHRIRELVDLRLIHVISEGITVGDAGRKFLALILDYGFYTGIRAAQSVDLFNKQTTRVAYKDLRKLPILTN
jgi:Cdc6-like AAA superfamily ATPase